MNDDMESKGLVSNKKGEDYERGETSNAVVSQMQKYRE